jgi:hypothetical protein
LSSQPVEAQTDAVSNAQGWSLLGIVGTMAAAIVALLGISLLAFRAQFTSLKDDMDAKFEAVGARFDGVDRRLDDLDRDVQTLFRDRY